MFKFYRPEGFIVSIGAHQIFSYASHALPYNNGSVRSVRSLEGPRHVSVIVGVDTECSTEQYVDMARTRRMPCQRPPEEVKQCC